MSRHSGHGSASRENKIGIWNSGFAILWPIPRDLKLKFGRDFCQVCHAVVNSCKLASHRVCTLFAAQDMRNPAHNTASVGMLWLLHNVVWNWPWPNFWNLQKFNLLFLRLFQLWEKTILGYNALARGESSAINIYHFWVNFFEKLYMASIGIFGFSEISHRCASAGDCASPQRKFRTLAAVWFLDSPIPSTGSWDIGLQT
jgi:hypothetical protein